MFKKICKSKIILVAVLLGLFVVMNYFLTWTLYNPAVMVPVYRFFVGHGIIVSWGEAENGDDLYPVVSIRDIERSRVWVPRVSVIGTISDQVKVFDGDMHLNIKSKEGDVLVGEIVPEFPVGAPPPGTCVKIWGIPRYDLEHRWWEIHPVIGWKESAKCQPK